MNDLKTLEAMSAGMGLEIPSLAYIAGVLLFSIIGYGVYRYGKKSERSWHKWTGVALMLYPYVVHQTWLMYVVGAGMCVALYFLPE
jgi:hypothetical protein